MKKAEARKVLRLTKEFMKDVGWAVLNNKERKGKAHVEAGNNTLVRRPLTRR